MTKTKLPRGIPHLEKVIIGAVLALAASWFTMQHKPEHSSSVQVSDGAYHRVAYVYDGDTIKLDNGERVRLIGIDTPESHENPKLLKDVQRRGLSSSIQIAMGKKAAAFTRALVSGKDVRLEYDVEPKDRYGRTLAYVFLSDGTSVNERIIREGYAYPLTIPPNVKHADDYKRFFDEARINRRGLWNERVNP